MQLLVNKGNDQRPPPPPPPRRRRRRLRRQHEYGTLGKLTGTLDSDTSQIEQLVTEYDSVSTVLAQRSPHLNDAITATRRSQHRPGRLAHAQLGAAGG